MVSGKESGFGEGLGYSLIPESRILIPDSLLGKRGSVRVGSAQLFSREVRGLRGLFGSSAAARVCGVYINSKRSKKTAPAEEAVLRTSRTSRSFL